MCRFFLIFFVVSISMFCKPFLTLQSGVSSRQAHDRLAFGGGPGLHM